MTFEPDAFYHVYNRGNNKQVIFPQPQNYDFFLAKVSSLLVPCCEIAAYCLMPNHFHFLLYTTNESVRKVKSTEIQTLSRRIGTLQSSYTRAINIQEGNTGTLFQQKYKAILLSQEHCINCFHYIHNNPVRAGISGRAHEWQHSSINEYMTGNRNVCNTGILKKVLGIAAYSSEDLESSDQYFLTLPHA